MSSEVSVAVNALTHTPTLSLQNLQPEDAELRDIISTFMSSKSCEIDKPARISASPPLASTEQKSSSTKPSGLRHSLPLPPSCRNSGHCRQEAEAKLLGLSGDSTMAPIAACRDVCFTIDGFITLIEAAHLIRTASPHLQPVDVLFAEEYRVSDRALLHTPMLAAELFDRVAPHLLPADYSGRVPMCFGHGGVWVPCGLNACFKVVRYEEGGHFALHRDGPWIPREDQASLFTLVVYLNDNFGGGATEVWGSDAVLMGTCDVVFARNTPCITVVPVAGTALVFNHDC